MSDPDAAGWRASWRKRLAVTAIGAIGAPLIAALGRTWRWEIDGGEHLAAVEPRFILAIFHGRILPGVVFFRARRMVVITSQNFDGEWIARIIAGFGYETARGSTSRGGVKALVQMKRAMAAGRSTAFTVDGPRGPRHHVQPGCLWLARASGCPILPVHIEADRHWTLGSWDRAQIPRPFSRVIVCIGEPFRVAPDTPDAILDDRRTSLESVLLGLGTRAELLVRRPA